MVRKKRNLGFSFPDEIQKVTGKFGHFKKGKESDWTETLLPNFDLSFGSQFAKSPWRVTVLYILCFIFFFIIFLRLFHLQIASGKGNRELADGNRIQVKVIHAPRGVIFDRNGKILASNSPAFRLFDQSSKKVKLISREEALELEVRNDPKSNDLEIDNVRTYPMGEKLAHALGYVGEISEQELKMEEFRNYRLGDRVGKSGIEAQYERILRGVDGGEIIEVDSQGHQKRVLRKNTPTAGQNIYLTIDYDLQSKIYDLTKDTLSRVGSCCGAVIALNPQNGQVLALLSFPSFDPNIFTKYDTEGAISEIFSSPLSPILNRAIGGAYPPGSTFKIISSLAALASGKFTKDTTIFDNGVMYLGTFKFSNWYFNQYGKTEGPVNLIKAIKRSNDIYFYHVGQTVGEQTLAIWARKLNLGQILGIDLPGEEMGLVPDDNWKQKTYNLPWYPGDSLHMAIGQGFVLTTPLQILAITSFIAADGILYRPQLIYRVIKDKESVEIFKSHTLLSKVADPNWIQTVKEGLAEVPSAGGTAWPFFTFPIKTAGKTGTAEYGDPKDRTHAWYSSFAPTQDPKIAMIVLIEGGGEGSNVSAPIVKETYRWYFSEDKNNLIKDVYIPATDSGKTLGE